MAPSSDEYNGCSSSCLLLKKRAREGGLSGSPGKQRKWVISSWAVTFSECLLHLLFHTKTKCSMEMVEELNTKLTLVATVFAHKMERALRLHRRVRIAYEAKPLGWASLGEWTKTRLLHLRRLADGRGHRATRTATQNYRANTIFPDTFCHGKTGNGHKTLINVTATG